MTRAAQDSVLGLLVWEPTEEAWVSAPQGARSFAIALVGDAAPDARILPYARELHADALAFEQAVAHALEFQVSRTPGITEILRSLRLDTVCLSSPERPRDGMVYFHCAEGDPVWRFDLVDGRPLNLGCDT